MSYHKKWYRIRVGAMNPLNEKLESRIYTIPCLAENEHGRSRAIKNALALFIHDMETVLREGDKIAVASCDLIEK